MKRKTCIFKNVAMLFIAIGLLAVFVGCNDKNDEVGPLRQEVQALRSDLTKSFDAKVDAKTDELQKQVDDLKARLAELSKNEAGVSAEELESVKKQIIDVTVAKTAFEEYKESVKAKIDAALTEADLKSLKDKIESVEPRVAALETLVGSNKAALDKALEDLGKEVKGLNTQISDLKSKIESNKSDLVSMLNEYKRIAKQDSDANAANIKTLNDELAKLEKKMNIGVVKAMLNTRLTGLVFLPEYVGNGGSLPIMMFSPIGTPCDDTKIDPVVEVKYMVNPSTVTKSDIDINNLKFVYNDPIKVAAKKSQAELVAPKAEFVSLENGVLTVRASLNVDNTWSAKGGDRIDQLMLQVPSAKGEEGEQQFVVNSDWARVISEPINDYYLGKKEMNDAFPLPKTLQEAKRNTTVVDLEYNETLDLNTVVKTLTGDRVLSDKAYGFKYKYDLNDKDGNKIVYELGRNDTDQQQFIKLDGSKISTRVYDIDGANPASVDRTPIVHVMLKSDKCDKNLKEAFIKINIVKTKGIKVDPVDFPAGDFVADCATAHDNPNDANLVKEIKTQEMNEKFYAATGLSKTEFHRNYNLYTNVDVDKDGNIDGVGVVRAKPDNGSRESHNLVWTVTPSQQWNALKDKDGKPLAEKEITKVVEYRSSSNVIRVTFKATIKRPTIDLSNKKLSNYWSEDKQYARFNIAVPEVNSTNSNLAVIKVDIDNIFDNVEGNGGDVVIKGWNNKYEYEYTFVEKQSYTDIPSEVKDEVIKLYGDDNMLYAKRYNTKTKVEGTPELVAEISTNNMIEYKQTTLAKYLLNIAPESMKVDLQMNVKDGCDHEIEANISNGNRFKVRFLRPINVDPVAAKNFVDGVDLGDAGSILKITDIVVLSDWRGKVANNENFNFEPRHNNYYKYYGVSSITIDENNIKVKGLNGNTLTGKPASINVKQQGAVDLDRQFFGEVTYENNKATLNKAFELHIPVTVTYKWGEVKTTVKVNVKPTSEASRKRVK